MKEVASVMYTAIVLILGAFIFHEVFAMPESNWKAAKEIHYDDAGCAVPDAPVETESRMTATQLCRCENVSDTSAHDDVETLVKPSAASLSTTTSSSKARRK